MKQRVPTLTRRDIARLVAERSGLRVHDSDRLVGEVLAAMRDLLMKADPEIRLEMRDFGVFEVKLTRAKPLARNPRTGESVFVPPRRKTHFRPSKTLKRFLREELDPTSGRSQTCACTSSATPPAEAAVAHDLLLHI
jgi:integration host factor subunit beta